MLGLCLDSGIISNHLQPSLSWVRLMWHWYLVEEVAWPDWPPWTPGWTFLSWSCILTCLWGCSLSVRLLLELWGHKLTLGRKTCSSRCGFCHRLWDQTCCHCLNLKMCLSGVGAEHTAQLNQCQGKNAGERHSHLVWAFALKRGIWKHSEWPALEQEGGGTIYMILA